MVNQRFSTANVRVDHNDAFATRVGQPVEPALTPASGVVIAGNTVGGFTNGILLAGNAASAGTQVLDNTTTANRLSGIQIGPSHTDALIEGNVSDGNVYGIRTILLVTGHTIVGNSMHGNTRFDAMESSYQVVDGELRLGNTWEANSCVTDSPAGAICSP